MRIFLIAETCTELEALPDALPARGFVWIASARREFEVGSPVLQSRLHQWGCGPLVDQEDPHPGPAQPCWRIRRAASIAK
jgi:hypothetical protein